jgi:hypothetical protein
MTLHYHLLIESAIRQMRIYHCAVLLRSTMGGFSWKNRVGIYRCKVHWETLQLCQRFGCVSSNSERREDALYT